jgi:hypothetical protein
MSEDNGHNSEGRYATGCYGTTHFQFDAYDGVSEATSKMMSTLIAVKIEQCIYGMEKQAELDGRVIDWGSLRFWTHPERKGELSMLANYRKREGDHG